MSHKNTQTITAGNYDFEYTCTYEYTHRVPAKLFGAPENCWPEEPCEIDFEKIVLEENDEFSEMEINEKDLRKSVLDEIKRKIQEIEESEREETF